jgi:uncharacterized caspase-like protein
MSTWRGPVASERLRDDCTPRQPTRRAALQQLLALGAGSALCAPAPAQTGSAGSGLRSALIVGNAAYAAAPLTNAGNDARLMQSVAQELGFQVTLLLDADLLQLLEAISRWLAQGPAGGTRLFYFAGHGAQYRGRNYLVPVDAELRSEADLLARALDATSLAERLSRRGQGVNLLVFDACRSAPMLSPPPGSRLRTQPGGRPPQGLAPVVAPRGTLVAYATAPGSLAADDPNSRNSPYTRNLAAQLRTPGLPIEAVFKRTRAAVLEETGGTQVPWESSSLVGELCLASGATRACGAEAPR